jgi:hypothetical protein
VALTAFAAVGAAVAVAGLLPDPTVGDAGRAVSGEVEPSGEAMPLGDLQGWDQVFTEDFVTPLSRGSFPGSYGDQWLSYDGFADTSGRGDYEQDIISAHDGMLDLYLHTEDGRPLGAAPVPLVDGEWGGQTYGRFSVRMKADPLNGFGVASLLWPDSENWSEGEIDFPEGAFDDVARASNHCPGDPEENCFYTESTAEFVDWHTYTIDWTPTRLSFLVDGVTVGTTTDDIPDVPMHWVLQSGTVDGTPDPDTAGHLWIDWATIYAYDPADPPLVEDMRLRSE